MEEQYRGEFLMMRIVSLAMGVVSIGMIVVTEVWRGSGSFQPAMAGEDGAATMAVLRIVFYVLSVILLALALVLKQAIRKNMSGGVRAIIRALAVSAHRRRKGSAFGTLVLIASLGEAVSVLGLVLFIRGGGPRLGYFPFFLAAVLAQVYFFPTEAEAPVLAEIDREALRQLRP